MFLTHSLFIFLLLALIVQLFLTRSSNTRSRPIRESSITPLVYSNTRGHVGVHELVAPYTCNALRGILFYRWGAVTNSNKR